MSTRDADDEEVRLAWDAIDEKTKETLRRFGLRPSHEAKTHCDGCGCTECVCEKIKAGLARSIEIRAAVDAWRGFADEKREECLRVISGTTTHLDVTAAGLRLLKAAGR